MILATAYLKPNITIQAELIGLNKFYVYNYQGIHYRVFNSLMNLQEFIAREYKNWIFECDTENKLEKYLYGAN